MNNPRIWKKVPEVGDLIRPYVTHPLQTITKVSLYTGRYPEHFTHVIEYTSPITISGRAKACWPMGGDCSVYLGTEVNES